MTGRWTVRMVEPDQAMWQTNAAFGPVLVRIEAAELAAYRLARMSTRLVQGLWGGGGDPEAVWRSLAATCTSDFAISRTLMALGRSAPLRGHPLEVRGIHRVRVLAQVEAPCALEARLRVLACEAQRPGCFDVTLAVALTREEQEAVATFELELRLLRGGAP